MTKTTIFTHRLRISLARLTFCWWRPGWLLMTSQWPDNCDTITWKDISNSLDIDFIHGNIHGWSCVKPKLITAIYASWIGIGRGVIKVLCLAFVLWLCNQRGLMLYNSRLYVLLPRRNVKQFFFCLPVYVSFFFGLRHLATQWCMLGTN